MNMCELVKEDATVVLETRDGQCLLHNSFLIDKRKTPHQLDPSDFMSEPIPAGLYKKTSFSQIGQEEPVNKRLETSSSCLRYQDADRRRCFNSHRNVNDFLYASLTIHSTRTTFRRTA